MSPFRRSFSLVAAAAALLAFPFPAGCTAASPGHAARCAAPPCGVVPAPDAGRGSPAVEDAGADPTDTAADTSDACVVVDAVSFSEVLYDPDGADDPRAEFVELAGPAGARLEGLRLRGIDGLSGAAYFDVPLTGAFDAAGIFVVPTLDEPLQNGPDGLVLVGCDGVTRASLGWGPCDPSLVPGELGPDVAGGRSLARCAVDGALGSSLPSRGLPNPWSGFPAGTCAEPAAVDQLDAGGTADDADDARASDAHADDTADAAAEPWDADIRDVARGTDAALATDARAGFVDAEPDAETEDSGGDGAPTCAADDSVALGEVYPRASSGDLGFIEVSGIPGTPLDGFEVVVVAADGAELSAALGGVVLDEAGFAVVVDSPGAMLTADASAVMLLACDEPRPGIVSWGTSEEPPPAGWGSSVCAASGAWGLARPTPGSPNDGWIDASACPGACVAPRRGALYINEVLADPDGTDSGREFVELRGTPLADLSGYALTGMNGSNGEAFMGPMPLVGRVPADGLVLIAGDLVAERDLALDGGIQNGPDSLILIGCDGTIVDALAWGTFGSEELAFGEGEPAARAAAGRSLARDASGRDSDDNAADFSEREPSPGGPNP